MPVYSPELASIVLTRIANGESVREISLDKDMPSREAIREWRNKYPEFSKAYLDAKRICAEEYFEEIEDLIKSAEDRVDLEKKRYFAETIKWKLSKMFPKKYGDKPDLDQEANDRGEDLSQRTEAELKAALADRLLKIMSAADIIKLIGEENANKG